jgi:molybdopterin-biosynthesis enzyme MoeA-like protein
VKYLRIVLAMAVFAFAVWTGAALENHRAVRAAADPGAMVALNQCGHFLGVIVVTKGGKVVEMPGLPIEAAQTLAKALPQGSAVAVTTPCGPPTVGT